MGARTPGVERINLVDRERPQDDGPDRESRLGASLGGMQLGRDCGGGAKEESKVAGREPGRGLQSKRASGIGWKSLVHKQQWETRTSLLLPPCYRGKHGMWGGYVCAWAQAEQQGLQRPEGEPEPQRERTQGLEPDRASCKAERKHGKGKKERC